MKEYYEKLERRIYNHLKEIEWKEGRSELFYDWLAVWGIIRKQVK